MRCGASQSPAAKKRRTSSVSSAKSKKASPAKATAKKRGATTTAAGKKKTTAAAKKKPAAASKPKAGKVKELKVTDMLDMAMKSFKWWEAEELPAGTQWRTLEHMGVYFAEPYEPHGVKMLYDGQPVDLTPEQEELATFFSSMPPDGPQLGDPKVAPVFCKNFFKDFKRLLGSGHTIQKFDRCDFTVRGRFITLASHAAFVWWWYLKNLHVSLSIGRTCPGLRQRVRHLYSTSKSSIVCFVRGVLS